MSELTPNAEQALLACANLENAVLVELEGVDWECGICLTLNGLQRRLLIHRDVIRGVVSSLRAQRLAAYQRGLWTDDGMPAGSGYHLTRRGYVHLRQLGLVDDQAGAVVPQERSGQK